LEVLLNGKVKLKKNNILKRIRFFFEKHGFSVCLTLANFLGIKVKNVRLFFIYASFTTIIGGFILYLIIGFLFKLRGMVYRKRSSVFDL
jgi:phage shock protein PspC (stress-responsive transcriptional regulator)